MKLFYFVGGPTDGHRDAFRRRLAAVGGSPPGWRIHPHAGGDGQALHVVEADGEASILAHLAQFDPIYQRGPIVEVVPGQMSETTGEAEEMDDMQSRITGTLSPSVEQLPRSRGIERNQDQNLDPHLGHPRVTRKWRIGRIVWTTLRVVGAGILAVLVIVFILFWQDLSAARERLAGASTDVYASQYGDIEYRLVGEGPTVLVSHGITGGLDSGESLVAQWRHIPDDYRFLYVSRFGYLNSSLPEDATPRLQAAAYKDLLDHLGIERTIVVGNSAGGASAMWFAIDYPERTSGLILLSSAVPGPVPDPIPQLVREHDFVYWAAVKFAPDMLIGMLLPESISATLTQEERDFVMDTAFKSSLPISERSEGIRFDNEVSVPTINDVPFERIEARTLILQSVDDPREEQGGREMANRIPNSQYLGLTGGHFLLRHEQEIRAATAAFIAGLTPAD